MVRWLRLSMVAVIVGLFGFGGDQVGVASPMYQPTIILRGVRFSGAVGLLTQRDRELATHAVGGVVGLADLFALADQLTLLLKGNGYLLAQAYLPPQDVTNGVVEIAVVEGTVEAVDFGFAPDVRVNEELLRRLMDRGIDRERLTRADLEGTLLRINDLPGVQARAQLRAGRNPGTSRIVVHVDQRPRLAAEFSMTNFGSNDTGRVQHALVLTFSNLSGAGDEIRFQGLVSQGTTLAHVSRSVPLRRTPDVTGRVHYQQLNYDVINGPSVLGLHGTSSEWGVAIRQAFTRTRLTDVSSEAGIVRKVFIDESAAGTLADRRLVEGTLSLVGSRRDGWGRGGVTDWSVRFTAGNVDLSGAPVNQVADAAGLQTAGGFSTLGVTARRVQRLGSGFSLAASFSGQWAAKNSDASHKFFLGGPHGVRSYPVGEGRGDAGMLANVELRYTPAIPSPWGSFELKAFLDAGHIRVHKDPGVPPVTNACECNSYGLTGVGAGLGWSLGGARIDVSWASALGENPGRIGVDGINADGSQDRHRLWVSGSLRF